MFLVLRYHYHLQQKTKKEINFLAVNTNYLLSGTLIQHLCASATQMCLSNSNQDRVFTTLLSNDYDLSSNISRVGVLGFYCMYF